MKELIRIPVSPDTHQKLKAHALKQGYKSLSAYLRAMIQRETQIDVGAGLKTWGGDRRPE